MNTAEQPGKTRPEESRDNSIGRALRLWALEQKFPGACALIAETKALLMQRK